MKLKIPIIIWYGVVIISLVLMILIGGITRLTDSGLSMVDWHLFLDMIPPLSEQQWIAEFNRYKAFPEFKVYHQHFELNDFKSIYFWEYLHRLFARFLGIIFILPLIFFLRKKVFLKKEKKLLYTALFFGCIQAFVGWYMVKSGLQDRPDISHLRLALHLSIAFIITLLIVKSLLSRLFSKPLVNYTSRIFVMIIAVLTFTQVILGAFVSGMKAGYAFNTWPKMGGQWIPDNLFYLDPFLRNLIDNPFVVQFIHRHLGVLIVLLIFAYMLYLYRKNSQFLQYWLISTGLAFFQMLFGIFTLLWKVPTLMASIHQILALFLLSSFLIMTHKMKYDFR